MIRAKQEEKGSRRILFAGLPLDGHNEQAEQLVYINYTGDSNAGNGVTLDGTVIPAIIKAVNGYEEARQLVTDLWAAAGSWLYPNCGDYFDLKERVESLTRR